MQATLIPLHYIAALHVGSFRLSMYKNCHRPNNINPGCPLTSIAFGASTLAFYSTRSPDITKCRVGPLDAPPIWHSRSWSPSRRWPRRITSCPASKKGKQLEPPLITYLVIKSQRLIPPSLPNVTICACVTCIGYLHCSKRSRGINYRVCGIQRRKWGYPADELVERGISPFCLIYYQCPT